MKKKYLVFFITLCFITGCENQEEIIKNEYPKDTINTLMNFTSTHDITRAINIFGTREFQYNGEWAWNLANNNIYWQKNYQLNVRVMEAEVKHLPKVVEATLVKLLII